MSILIVTSFSIVNGSFLFALCSPFHVTRWYAAWMAFSLLVLQSNWFRFPYSVFTSFEYVCIMSSDVFSFHGCVVFVLSFSPFQLTLLCTTSYLSFQRITTAQNESTPWKYCLIKHASLVGEYRYRLFNTRWNRPISGHSVIVIILRSNWKQPGEGKVAASSEYFL